MPRPLQESPLRYLSLLLLVVLGCGETEPSQPSDDPGSEEADPAEEPSASLAPVEEQAPRYALHEWGLLQVTRGEGTALLRTGAGSFPAPRPTPVAVPTIMNRPAAARAPVVYAHLLDDGPVAFELRVQQRSGTIVEHYPAVGTENGRVEWSVRARAGSCDPEAYPTVEDPRCETPDGLCELAELERYETADGACLEVEGKTFDHLFYRGELPEVELPVGVALEGEELVVRGEAGSVLQLSRNGAAVRTAVFEISPEGVRVPRRPSEGDAAEGQAWIDRVLTARGLTDNERAAFRRAWDRYLFGGEGEGEPVQTDPASGAHRPVRDGLLYVLPDSGAVSSLEATPPPAEVRRAIVVLVDLRLR